MVSVSAEIRAKSGIGAFVLLDARAAVVRKAQPEAVVGRVAVSEYGACRHLSENSGIADASAVVICRPLQQVADGRQQVGGTIHVIVRRARAPARVAGGIA